MAGANLKDRLLFWLATRLGWLFIRLWGRLARLEVVGREHFDRLQREQRAFIICIWHGRILMPIFAHRNEGIVAMVSEHRDGEMIAQTLKRLGYGTVRGSSTRGGRKAAIAMLRELRQGVVAGLMPDGPRGPRHQFKRGALVLAQKSGAALLPMTFAAARCWQFRSWDRFTMWKPFSRVLLHYGEPVEVPLQLDEAGLEALRHRVEQIMIEQEKHADAYFHP